MQRFDSRYPAPLLRDTEPPGGSIVNAASFLAEIGAATAQMGYAAAKAGVVQLIRDLGVNLARSGCGSMQCCSGRSTPPRSARCSTAIPARSTNDSSTGRWAASAPSTRPPRRWPSWPATTFGSSRQPRCRSTAGSRPHSRCPTEPRTSRPPRRVASDDSRYGAAGVQEASAAGRVSAEEGDGPPDGA
jgi:NAD(P)-dependent dehydrogenase (short-subunit alcohol dehydrogenase family)